MRRSLCICEPSSARAGQIATWKFQYTTSVALPKGAKVKFDMQSKGRGIDWEMPSNNLKEKQNVIYLLLEKGEVIAAKEIEVPDTIIPQFEFTLTTPVKVGGVLTIVMGAPPKTKSKEEAELGTMAQLTLQRRRPFLLYIDPKGKGNYEEPEVFSLDVKGNALHTIRILSPSFVAKNKRFDITVRFEDEFGNLTNNAPPDTLIDLSYEHLRENLNWKLFVPETGFVILPNLYFNEAGVYRIQLRNMKTKEICTSAPIKCFQENDRNLFWGLVHGESDRVDSTENIESCLRHFRDEKALNFFGTSCFESQEETSNEIWKLLSQNIQEFNEEERFATFLGFQYKGDTGKEGLREIIYYKDNKPLMRQKDIKTSSLAKVYKSLPAHEMLAIPSFTMGKSAFFDFKEFDPTTERVVEIYNAWGCSERTKAEGNPRPITGGVEETKEGSILNALKQNHRFGFVAGGLDDRGIYGSFFDSDQVQYSPGLTAVMCKKYSREAIFEALFQRSCYATTGPKIIVGFYVAGQPMGSELNSGAKPGLIVNRHISGFVAGTAKIKRVEIVRNGDIIKTFTPDSTHFDYFHDDLDPLGNVTLNAKNAASPFVFYYIRVIQEDEHLAWGSPVWVDYVKEPLPPKKK